MLRVGLKWSPSQQVIGIKWLGKMFVLFKHHVRWEQTPLNECSLKVRGQFASKLFISKLHPIRSTVLKNSESWHPELSRKWIMQHLMEVEYTCFQSNFGWIVFYIQKSHTFSCLSKSSTLFHELQGNKTHISSAVQYENLKTIRRFWCFITQWARVGLDDKANKYYHSIFFFISFNIDINHNIH